MHLDARLGSAELCPPEDAQTKIDGSRVEGKHLPFYFKLFVDSLSSRNVYHMVGKLFEDTRFSYSIKDSLWQELYELSEDIFSGVHRMTDLLLDCKDSQFKSSPSIFCSKTLYLSNLQTSPLFLVDTSVIL